MRADVIRWEDGVARPVALGDAQVDYAVVKATEFDRSEAGPAAPPESAAELRRRIGLDIPVIRRGRAE